jgi:predicted N-acetyltransferase YhbS
MEFRTVRTAEEQQQAINLSKKIFKDNMDKQFTSLFSEENWNHMFIALDNNKIVSLLNYYPSKVQIGPTILKLASVGSVCTDEQYRGQKIASTLLSLAEKQMIIESIDLIVISGWGGIYSAFGATLAGNVYEYNIQKDLLKMNEDIQVVPYQEEDYPSMVDIQKQESVRFIREVQEFKRLLQAQTYQDEFATYPIFMVKNNENIVGYFIGILATEGDEIGIKEFAGNREFLFHGLYQLTSLTQRDKVHFAVDCKDDFVHYLEKYENKKIHQHASFKIINELPLLRKLSVYIRELFPQTSFCYILEENHVKLMIENEELKIKRGEELIRFVFGHPDYPKFDLSDKTLLNNLVSKVFPVPFVWTNNINYQ